MPCCGPPYYNRIATLLKAAQHAAVGFELIYQESCDQWYGRIISAARSENTITRDGTFDDVISDLLTHLNGLQR